MKKLKEDTPTLIQDINSVSVKARKRCELTLRENVPTLIEDINSVPEHKREELTASENERKYDADIKGEEINITPVPSLYSNSSKDDINEATKEAAEVENNSQRSTMTSTLENAISENAEEIENERTLQTKLERVDDT